MSSYKRMYGGGLKGRGIAGSLYGAAIDGILQSIRSVGRKRRRSSAGGRSKKPRLSMARIASSSSKPYSGILPKRRNKLRRGGKTSLSGRHYSLKSQVKIPKVSRGSNNI